jgi:glycosidase
MAEMIPVEFFKWVIASIRTFYPNIQFIGECYQPALYQQYLDAGFDYLYDKVGMYDYLRGVTSKSWPAEGITQRWQAVEQIRDKMVYFLENHDEQRIASGFFCGSGHCAEPAMTVAATLGANPVLVYAGQELGETGMDVEGFSGMDGRTTIFDYWGIRSLQAWANHGKFDGKYLTDDQKDLRLFYQRLLTLARDNKAVAEGKMYDLEYAQGENFNKHEQYAYLRKQDDEVLLIVVNFDDRAVEIDVQIPKDAFDYLEQAEWEQASAIDLLTGTKYKQTSLCSSQPVHLSLQAWKSVVMRFEETKKKRR